MKKLVLFLSTIVCLTSIIVTTYIGVVYANVPVVANLRDIYIETAMTTGEHQWLATRFFPKDLIDEVMRKQISNPDIIVRTELNNPEAVVEVRDKPVVSISLESKNSLPSHEEITYTPKDILNQQSLKVWDLDYVGNKVLVNDIAQGIVISEVTGTTFKGKIALIDDPSRVFIGITRNKGIKGESIVDYLERDNAIVGVNANGFPDDNGVGFGGTTLGITYSHGEEWGRITPDYSAVAFDQDNRLIVGNVQDWNAYNIRDGAQFVPPLIANGKSLIEGSGGWGLQPRTIVGQRKDGVVMFLVIDGRQPGHSVGATMGDCANILLAYGAETAGALDGGSSSIMAYDSQVITKCSSPAVNGRLLPNAFLVKRK